MAHRAGLYRSSMNPILSLNVLQHPNAMDALSQYVTSSFFDNTINGTDCENDDSVHNNLHWIKQWPIKLTPKQYLQSSKSSFAPSVNAKNAICLAHKFALHAIRFFDLEKGAHFAAVHIQTALAPELYLLFSRQDHQFERALELSDAVLNYLAYWNEGLGTRGSKSIRSIMHTLASDEDLSNKISHVKEITSEAFDQLEKMRTKLTEMVEAQLSRRECQQQCARAIREAAHQHKLTPTCAGFLSGPWYDAIQHIYLTEGEKSSIWKNCLVTTKEFVNVFAKSDTSEEDDNSSFTTIKNEIVNFLNPIQHSDNEYTSWLDSLETDYWAIKKHLDIEFNGELNLPIIDIGDSLELNISEKLIRKAKSYFEGDWFSFSGNYSGRSQILAISKNGHRYIFNNLNGQKTFDFSIKEFAYLLANAHAKHIESVDISDVLLEKITNEALRKYTAAKKPLKQAPDANKQAYKHKALQEAQNIQQRHIKAEKDFETKQKSTLENNSTDDLEERIRILEVEKSLLQLDLGQWITFRQGDEKKKLRLAVKLSSSNKYVFTNELGLGRQEFSSDELVSHILSKVIEIHPK